jgi:predicted kinase
MEKVVIIIRGLQGSGKSSVAKLFETKAICSADDYFVRDGVYEWYGMGLPKAHQWCIRKCRRFMMIEAQRIVIDNTAVKARDLKPYYGLAEDYGYKVFSIVVENRHGGINSHGVPEDAIQRLREKFDIKL